MLEPVRTRALIRSEPTSETSSDDRYDFSNPYTDPRSAQPSQSFFRRNRCIVYVFASLGTLVSVLFFLVLTFLISGHRKAVSALAFRLTSIEEPEIPTPKSRALPTNLMPRHYDLKLTTDFVNFSGHATIYATCLRSTNVIQFYVGDMAIWETRVRPRVGYPNGSEIAKLLPNKERSSYVAVRLSWYLEPHTDYRISTRFKGTLYHARQRGLIRERVSSYYTIVSIMDNLESPKSFPILDDAEVKMTFNVSLLRPNASFVTLSSWDLLKDVPNQDARVLSVFERTVPIWPHQVGLAFTNLPKVTDGFTTLRALPSQIENLRYLVEFGSNIVERASEVTGRAYPHRGCDLLAVQELHRACHSTWKLFIIRADVFVVVSSQEALERASLRFAAQVLSTWFGGFVSVGSWMDRALALLYAIKVVKLIKPQWLLDTLLHAYRFVALLNVNDRKTLPNDWTALFDFEVEHYAIALLVMFRAAIGQDSFQRGVTAFLSKSDQSNLTVDDFWDALKDASSNEDLPQYARFWKSQPGYPCLNVSRENAETIHVIQRPCCCAGLKKEPIVWPIPITFTYSSEPKSIDTRAVVVWMTTPDLTLQVPNAHFNDWVLLNVENEGIYRVDYQDSNWDHLIRQLLHSPTDIPLPNRAQILDDLFYLAAVGYRTFDRFFSAATYLEIEREALPWTHFMRLANLLPAEIEKTQPWVMFNRHICDKIVADIVKEDKSLGTSASTSFGNVFHEHVLQYCCKFIHNACLTTLRTN